MDVEVPEHFVGAPTAKEPDAVGVDVRAEKGHGASGAKGASGDIGGQETVRRTQQTDGGAEEGCEVCGGDAPEV